MSVVLIAGWRGRRWGVGAHTSALRRVLYTSSTRVYPQSGEEWVDEDSSTSDRDLHARLLLEGESAARDTSAPAVVVRFAGIYGPGRTRDRPHARWRTVQRGIYTNRIHRDGPSGRRCGNRGQALPQRASRGEWLPVYPGFRDGYEEMIAHLAGEVGSS